jgi:phosphoribosylanthranilate isomerase
MTWVKICANTNLEDARVAVEAGADAVGFVFAAESPRRVDAQQVRDIVSQLPPEVEKVGVFVNAPAAEIRSTVKLAGLTAVQLHGEESNAFAEHLFPEGERPRIYRGLSLKTVFSAASGAGFLRGKSPVFDAVLVDSGSATQHGGTGLTFDWSRAQPFIRGLRKKYKVIVAGGLTPQNVAQAIDLFRPWGVDVATGVESAPGRKDHDKVRAFIAAVKSSKF